MNYFHSLRTSFIQFVCFVIRRRTRTKKRSNYIMKWTFFSLYSWVRLPYENIEHDLHQHSTRITYTFDSRVCDWTHANAKCDGDSFHTWCTFSWTLNVKSPTNCSVHAWVTVRPVQFIVLLWKWLNLFDSIARAHLYITTLNVIVSFLRRRRYAQFVCLGFFRVSPQK